MQNGLFNQLSLVTEHTAIITAKCFQTEFLSYSLFVVFTDIETNECLEYNGGCWQDKAANITACKVWIINGGLVVEFSCTGT